MLDGWWRGELAGSGMIIWDSRRRLASGEISYSEFLDRTCSSAPSAGHCNTMGTASTMNAMAEALGMSLTGCSAIPAPFRERSQMSYRTGRRSVEIVLEDLRPSIILTREAFLNAIIVNTAIGGSTNAPPHLQAIARHAGVDLSINDWQEYGYKVPMIVNMQPSGKYLGESFYRAGGVPAVMGELLREGLLDKSLLTIGGSSLETSIKGFQSLDREVISTVRDPFRREAGFKVISGNLFESALMKTSVISEDFQKRFLNRVESPGKFIARAIVFEGPEDYHQRINDESLNIDGDCMLFIRNVGPVGYPGAAEVVNMQPPDALIASGIEHLPTVGDGRQSGTSDSPSILNASPEAAVGGGLAILRTGDQVILDIKKGQLNLNATAEEIRSRWENYKPFEPVNQTPWQEIYRSTVGHLADGGCMELATRYQKVATSMPRDNH